jgi:HD superfamily phosphodiesterase
MENSLLQILLSKSKEIMETDKMYHDFAHAKNVYENAQILLKKLGGDEIVVLTGALFHDIARDGDNHEIEGAKQLRDILENIPEFPKDKIEETCIAVEHHEKGQVTHNEKILADADKIDAYSELSIGRSFMMSAHKGMKLKEAIQSFSIYLDKWYEEFNFEESKIIAKKEYENMKNLLNNMLKKYN